jgi:hypothetical protein
VNCAQSNLRVWDQRASLVYSEERNLPHHRLFLLHGGDRGRQLRVEQARARAQGVVWDGAQPTMRRLYAHRAATRHASFNAHRCRVESAPATFFSLSPCSARSHSLPLPNIFSPYSALPLRSLLIHFLSQRSEPKSSLALVCSGASARPPRSRAQIRCAGLRSACEVLILGVRKSRSARPLDKSASARQRGYRHAIRVPRRGCAQATASRQQHHGLPRRGRGPRLERAAWIAMHSSVRCGFGGTFVRRSAQAHYLDKKTRGCKGAVVQELRAGRQFSWALVAAT